MTATSAGEGAQPAQDDAQSSEESVALTERPRLPATMTVLVGREREVGAVRRLLERPHSSAGAASSAATGQAPSAGAASSGSGVEPGAASSAPTGQGVRLLTLTGPGGVG